MDHMDPIYVYINEVTRELKKFQQHMEVKNVEEVLLLIKNATFKIAQVKE